MLCARSITVTRGQRALLAGVDLTVPPGQVTVLIGPNGAGKSTLLRVLAGDLDPTKGTVLLDQDGLRRHGTAKLARRRAVMMQANPIVFDFTVEEILNMGWIGDDLVARDREVRQLAHRSQLSGLLPRTFNTLSGGEQQRAHFARAVLQLHGGDRSKSQYLLLDEPTASLDLAHEQVLLKQVQALAAQGIGVLVVLHDLNLAARYADRVVLLADGEVRAEGTPETVLDDALLTETYGLPLTVEYHSGLGRLAVHA
ncbi:MAG: heme ABC transporter ATP-binding protein [Pseudomonadota bacterium]